MRALMAAAQPTPYPAPRSKMPKPMPSTMYPASTGTEVINAARMVCFVIKKASKVPRFARKSPGQAPPTAIVPQDGPKRNDEKRERGEGPSAKRNTPPTHRQNTKATLLGDLCVLVGLTRLESNKYRKLASRKSLLPSESAGYAPGSRSDNLEENEYGEKEVKQIRQTQKYLSDQERAEIADAYRSGKTTYELAEQYGCHRQTIADVLKKQGIVPNKAKSQKKLNVETVIRMYSEFHSAEEIGNLYGVGRAVIIKCLRDNGIAIRSRWDYPRN